MTLFAVKLPSGISLMGCCQAIGGSMLSSTAGKSTLRQVYVV